MQNRNNITVTNTELTTIVENQTEQQLIVLRNPDTNALPESPFPVENSLIQQINDLESLESLRNQLINNLNARLVDTNMGLFPEFVTNISNEEREMLYNILTESTIVNNYQPALTLLAIFTNYNGMVNLDIIISSMTSTILEQMNNTDVLSISSLPNPTIPAAIQVPISSNIEDIVAQNSAEIRNLNRNFVTDIMSRSSNAIRQIRFNDMLQRIYQFLLAQPQLVIQILHLINNRNREIGNSDNNNSRPGNNQSLRQILINVYDWLSDIISPRPRPRPR
jgi:hypothetical protein